MREEGVGCWVSANENSCAHHVTWSPNKLWIYNSIFNLCYGPNLFSFLPYSEAGLLQSCKMITFKPGLWIWIRITIHHYLYGSGSFHYQAKKAKNPWLLLFHDFFMTFCLWRLVNVPSKSKKQKKLRKKLIFCWHLEKFHWQKGSRSLTKW